MDVIAETVSLSLWFTQPLVAVWRGTELLELQVGRLDPLGLWGFLCSYAIHTCIKIAAKLERLLVEIDSTKEIVHCSLIKKDICKSLSSIPNIIAYEHSIYNKHSKIQNTINCSSPIYKKHSKIYNRS